MSPRLRRCLSAVTFVALCSVLAVCDVDLFGSNRRTIVGPYGLYNGEETFYVVLDGPRFAGGSLGNRESLGGQVRQIGWNNEVILFEQETCGGDCPRAGWLMIHVSTRSVEGPIDPTTIETRHDLQSIEIMNAASAWKKLQ